MNSEIQDSVFQNCARQYWFKQVDPNSAKYAAEMCGIAMVDPYKIHSVEVRTRMENTGEYSLEEVISEGEWKSGEQKGKSINKNIVARAIYREKSEEFKKYHSLQDQVMMLQKEITNLGVGYAIIRSDTCVSPTGIYIPMKRYIWDDMMFSRNPPRTLAQQKLAQHIAYLKTTPAYHTPTPNEPWKIPKPSKSTESRAKRGMR